MKKTKLFNNVSPELLKNTKLKQGEQVVYRIHNIERNPMDPTKWAIPSVKSVPVSDQIWDEKLQEFVDIAAVRSVDSEGNHSFHDLYFYRQQGGYMILHAGRATDQEIHSYLMLCNYNGSNPNRDTTKEIIFEMVDEGKKSEVEMKRRNTRREALNIAAELSPEEVKNYIAALGQDDTRKIEVLRNELESLADNDPSEFLDLINNKQAIMKATINRALKKGVISFDEEQSRFSWPTGEAILTVSRSTGGDNVEELISYCVSSAKGEKVYQTIQSKSKK
jgi:hypothetical protein